MKNWIKAFSILAVGVSASIITFAQDGKDNAPKASKEQDIIIRKKGDKVGKTTIVIDGENITINGKPMDEYKNDDLTVLRRNSNSNFSITSPRLRSLAPAQPGGGFKMFNNNGEMFRSNKALLGVVTEKTDNGVKVTDVNKESGADKAGLKKDDIITKVGDAKIDNPTNLIDAIGKYKPNDKVDVTYKRGNKESKTAVTLGENKSRNYAFNMDDNNNFNFNIPTPPNAPGASIFNFNRRPRIGLQIQDVEEGKGVTVKDVDDDSPASKAGFKEGDVITEVDGKQVEGVDQLRSELKDLKEGDSVKVKYKRGGSTQTAEIKLPKRMKTADL